MIRDVIIYFHGRLPLLADLPAMPTPADQAVLATNVRTRDGKRPSFVEADDSWFFFPLREVMVIEVPRDAMDAPAETDEQPRRRVLDEAADLPRATDEIVDPDLDIGPLEPDEDLLARIRDL